MRTLPKRFLVLAALGTTLAGCGEGFSREDEIVGGWMEGETFYGFHRDGSMSIEMVGVEGNWRKIGDGRYAINIQMSRMARSGERPFGNYDEIACTAHFEGEHLIIEYNGSEEFMAFRRTLTRLRR